MKDTEHSDEMRVQLLITGIHSGEYNSISSAKRAIRLEFKGKHKTKALKRAEKAFASMRSGHDLPMFRLVVLNMFLRKEVRALPQVLRVCNVSGRLSDRLCGLIAGDNKYTRGHAEKLLDSLVTSNGRITSPEVLPKQIPLTEPAPGAKDKFDEMLDKANAEIRKLVLSNADLESQLDRAVNQKVCEVKESSDVIVSGTIRFGENQFNKGGQHGSIELNNVNLTKVAKDFNLVPLLNDLVKPAGTSKAESVEVGTYSLQADEYFLLSMPQRWGLTRDLTASERSSISLTYKGLFEEAVKQAQLSGLQFNRSPKKTGKNILSSDGNRSISTYVVSLPEHIGVAYYTLRLVKERKNRGYLPDLELDKGKNDLVGLDFSDYEQSRSHAKFHIHTYSAYKSKSDRYTG